MSPNIMGAINPSTSLSLYFVFGLIAVLGTIVSIENTRKVNNEKETEKRLDNAEQFATINVKLDTLNTNISELGKKNESSISEIQKINQTLVLEKERVGTLLKIQEEHEQRIKELENEIRRN